MTRRNLWNLIYAIIAILLTTPRIYVKLLFRAIVPENWIKVLTIFHTASFSLKISTVYNLKIIPVY